MALSEKYVAAALDRACAAVSSATAGGRNDLLNSESYGIGQLVGADVLEYSRAETALLAAAQASGMDRKQALDTINSGLRGGMKKPRDGSQAKQPPAHQQKDHDTSQYAARLYREAGPIAGTVVERYLRETRGLALDAMPRGVRCHAGVKHTGAGRTYPAMIAPVTTADGARVDAVHVTWIDPDTVRKAGDPSKKMYGACKGGAIWLADYAAHMLVAEGIEKTLACMIATGLPGVAGLSSTLLPSVVWPRAMQRITICADPNPAGEKAINRAAAALVADGIEVRVCYPPTPGQDWDECDEGDVFATIMAAKAWRAPVEPEVVDIDQPAETNEEHKPKKKAKSAALTTFSEVLDDFDRDENGKILKNERNINRALEASGVSLAYDEFAYEYRIEGLEGYGPELTDDTLDELYLLLQREYCFKPTFDDFRRVIKSAGRRARYHPIRAYLNGLVWDGIDRLDEWLTTFAGAPDTPLIRAQARIMLIAAVRRVRQPGCKFDEMIVLESPEGRNKSSALQLLAGEPWFTDDAPLQAGPRETIERLRGRWIVECAELKGIRSIEIEQLKAFLSRSTDSATLKYERETTKFPRQCIFVGSTNEDNYLFASTGNRRFWPIPIEMFDLENLARCRDQLWAEAAYWEAKGESIRLAPELWGDARDMQSQREDIDEWVTLVAAWLESEMCDTRNLLTPGGPRFTLADIAKGALALEAQHFDTLKQKRLARCVKRCNWTPTRKSNGHRYWEPETGR